MSDSDTTRGIAILGSTGSIGTQALDVIREQKDRLHVEVLSAHRNAAQLIAVSYTHLTLPTILRV